jgi:hypothetical protein
MRGDINPLHLAFASFGTVFQRQLGRSFPVIGFIQAIPKSSETSQSLGQRSSNTTQEDRVQILREQTFRTE